MINDNLTVTDTQRIKTSIVPENESRSEESRGNERDLDSGVDDMEDATLLARRIVVSHGMGPLGRI